MDKQRYQFSTRSIERRDKIRALSTLTPQERKVYCLAVDEDMKQKNIAKCLGITQGAVSSAFNRARLKLDVCDLSKDNFQDDIVWVLWRIFMRDFELPDFLEVEIESVIRGLFVNLLPVINWFYSIGELCNYILCTISLTKIRSMSIYRNIFQTLNKNEERHVKS